MALSAILLTVFAAMGLTARTYPNPAGTFPLIVGAIGSALAVIVLVRSAAALGATGDRSAAPSALPHAVMFGWILAAIGLIAAAGILLGAAAFTTVFLTVRERRPLKFALPSALSLPLVLHVVIERGFSLPLYGGLWP
jgi:hypothetical protein